MVRFGRGQPLTYPAECVWRHKWIPIPTVLVQASSPEVQSVVSDMRSAVSTWALGSTTASVELITSSLAPLPALSEVPSLTTASALEPEGNQMPDVRAEKRTLEVTQSNHALDSVVGAMPSPAKKVRRMLSKKSNQLQYC